ncbi:MAG: class II aldolase [Spirochaetales bacterium]|nr:MAG: class II aldolase [Spirochaetales bacterium]
MRMLQSTAKRPVEITAVLLYHRFMSLEKLAELSRYYGSDEEYVLAGGGNTSWKDREFIYIKASGFALSDITAEGFAKMDRPKLDAVWRKTYPENRDIRETEALADLMSARVPGETKRPSVETLLHALFPQVYVVHMHPALVNGLTCGKDGEKAAAGFPGSLWIPTVNPGYILAKTIKDRVDVHVKAGNAFPKMLFLQNHGVFVAADTPEEITKSYEKLMNELKKKVKRFPDLVPAAGRDSDLGKRSARFQGMLKDTLANGYCAAAVNGELLTLSNSAETMLPVMSSFTPDHIVYAGHKPLYVGYAENETDQRKLLDSAAAGYRKEWNRQPKIIVLEGTGAFSCQTSQKAAETAIAVFNDAVKVSVYAESFGGRQFMPEDQVNFILTWEVEQYRAKVSAG